MKFKSQQTAQKLRGGYYTPQNLADYVTKWVLASNPRTILEPSCGDGVFFQSLYNNHSNIDLEIVGFEILDTEANKAQQLCAKLGFQNYSINKGDFLEWACCMLKDQNETFDGILGNPPFIRYQFLDKKFQEHTENIFDILKLHFTKHTNAWVPFVLSSVSLLKKGGRLGMVIPSEIINVMHAQSLRTYLGNICSKIVIIDPKEIWFSDTLQGAVILLVEKKYNIQDHSDGVSIKSVTGLDFLRQEPQCLFNESQAINGETIIGKWTKAILEKNELSLIKKIIHHPSVYKFDNIAKVEVGIVTGANDFFLVNNEIVEQYDLQNYVKPMFGRSQHCQGVIYNKYQHDTNTKKGLPTNFVYIEESFETLPIKVQEYIQSGESELLHKRYKCKIRNPWYKVPSVFTRKLCMLKRAHDTPRLIFNEYDAYTTDTAYRIDSKLVPEKKLAYCFLNPLTAIFAEIEGRSYGGGVLELVPSEIRKLYIPIPETIICDIEYLDKLVRTLSMTEVLNIQGKHILSQLGLKNEEIDMLLNIWIKLRNRRQRLDIKSTTESNTSLCYETETIL